uniref:Uncharacterized protein n=1 Tax=Rhizophora mucronata TaxID=61149 RepID=A0A2P2QZU7_RHIMU
MYCITVIISKFVISLSYSTMKHLKGSPLASSIQ